MRPKIWFTDSTRRRRQGNIDKNKQKMFKTDIGDIIIYFIQPS